MEDSRRSTTIGEHSFLCQSANEGTFCVVPAHKEQCVCVYVHVGEIPLFHAWRIMDNVQ